MSDWVEDEIKRVPDFTDRHLGTIQLSAKWYLEVLRVAGLAEEALRSCEDYRVRNDMGKWFDSDKVEEALAAFKGLEKETG